MTGTPSIKRILIRCTSTIKSSWTTAPDNLFETVNYNGTDEDWLVLFLSPIGGWRRINNHLDETPSPQFSSTTALLQTSRVYRSWEGSVEGCRAEVHGILEEIAIASTESGNCDRFTPVVIQDCATPESTDVRTALAAAQEPSTQRSGILTVSESSGLTVDGNDVYWLPQGFKFTFQELEARVT